MTIEIQLRTEGYVALVDDEDKDLAEYAWYLQNSKAEIRTRKHWPAQGNHHQICRQMHREIVRRKFGRKALSGNLVVWFHDGNSLNCQRENIELITRSELMIRTRKATSLSGWLGVTWVNGRWRAQVTKDGKLHYGGTFEDDEEAARARDKLAVELFGPSIKLNFPNGDQELVNPRILVNLKIEPETFHLLKQARALTRQTYDQLIQKLLKEVLPGEEQPTETPADIQATIEEQKNRPKRNKKVVYVDREESDPVPAGEFEETFIIDDFETEPLTLREALEILSEEIPIYLPADDPEAKVGFFN